MIKRVPKLVHSSIDKLCSCSSGSFQPIRRWSCLCVWWSRSGRRPRLLQRRQGGRDGDLCQRRRAGPDPVGAGHVPGHRPITQARPAHPGAETQLQRRRRTAAGRTHITVL